MLIQTGGKISSVYNGGVILIKCTPPTLPVHTCTGDKYYSVQPCPNHVKYQNVAEDCIQGGLNTFGPRVPQF